MSESPDLLSQLKRTAQSLTSVSRPWPVFLDFTAIDFPSSISDATTRVSQNLTHFRANYALIILLIFFLSLITRPLALIAFFIALLAWLVLYFARDEPLAVCGFEVNDWIVLVLLVVATVVVLTATGIWFNVILAAAIAAGLVLLHASLRSTDDLKREAPAGEKLEPVRTHLRNMIIVPEMIGSVIGDNGKTFNQVEINPEMIGHYLAEFSISYKPVKHGRLGIGATHSSRFISLK
ncbi:PRA1 family protein D [Linum perenne]